MVNGVRKTRSDKRLIEVGVDDGTEIQNYFPPAMANPGNKIEGSYTFTATEMKQLLDEPSDVISVKVGGGLMGSPLSHLNEAPFPESLVVPFVRCFCPPDGIVCDPFSGSGTTISVARKWGRRAIGCDLRESQAELTRRRVAELPTMFDAIEEGI
jgi:DNA modification methylase